MAIGYGGREKEIDAFVTDLSGTIYLEPTRKERLPQELVYPFIANLFDESLHQPLQFKV